MKLYHILGTCELSSFFKSSQTVERRGNAFSVVIFLHRTFSRTESKSMTNFRAVSAIEHMNVIETVEDKHDNFLHKVGRQGITWRVTEGHREREGRGVKFLESEAEGYENFLVEEA